MWLRVLLCLSKKYLFTNKFGKIPIWSLVYTFLLSISRFLHVCASKSILIDRFILNSEIQVAPNRTIYLDGNQRYRFGMFMRRSTQCMDEGVSLIFKTLSSIFLISGTISRQTTHRRFSASPTATWRWSGRNGDLHLTRAGQSRSYVNVLDRGWCRSRFTVHA